MPEVPMPQVGETAPPIHAEMATGEQFDLAEHRGGWVVVYFYPRANTPGWTHEAKDFQQHAEELESLNALVVGVSADKPEIQRRFIDKFDLTFPMIPDTEKSIIGAYGARKVLGVTATRSTFLIAPDGKVAHVWPKVKLEGHADDVVGVIRSLAERA